MRCQHRNFRVLFSAHLKLAEASNAKTTLVEAHALLEEGFGFFLVMSQLETQCLDEENAASIDVTSGARR